MMLMQAKKGSNLQIIVRHGEREWIDELHAIRITMLNTITDITFILIRRIV